MSVDDFLAASEAAEQSLDFLVAAESCAARGEERDARACLDAVAMLATSALAEVLDDMKDDLAGVAEGPIVQHGPNGAHHFASAHEAITDLWLLASLHRQPWSSGGMSLDWLGFETSVLRAHLRRERARLIKQLPPKPSARRAGRPNKNEKGSEAKTLAALIAHHDYDNGDARNHERATNRQLADDFKLSANALSRYLRHKLGKDGQKQYERACDQGTIGTLLRLWNGEMPSRHRQLRDEEEAKPRQADRGLGDEDD